MLLKGATGVSQRSGDGEKARAVTRGQLRCGGRRSGLYGGDSMKRIQSTDRAAQRDKA